MVLKDDVVVENGCQIIDLLDDVVVPVVTLFIVVATVIVLAFDPVIRVAVVREAVDLLVLRIRQLGDVSLLHDQTLHLMTLGLKLVVWED